MSFFDHVDEQPPDPIFGITDAFNKDTHPSKMNLGVGAYRDEEGKPWVLPTVIEAETRMLNERLFNKEYLPILGLPAFNKVAARLLFGESSKSESEDRLLSVQTLSGTGALSLAFTFLKRFLPGNPKVYITNPTWANHINLVQGVGLDWEYFRYYHAGTNGLDFDGMMEDLSKAPEGSIILLHVVAHNPTGVDPTEDQWRAILDLLRQRRLYPLLDCAYQGFASGSLEKDGFACRLFEQEGMEFMVCQSFAKNFGLYRERVGGLHVVSNSSVVKERISGQVSNIVRQLYSNPPAHGAEIIAVALGDDRLTEMWKRDIQIMAGRIIQMRKELFDELMALKVPGTWNHIIDQIGMFSYLGLSKPRVLRLTEVHHIYLTSNGRISMAGLNVAKCKALAAAIAEVIESVPDNAKI